MLERNGDWSEAAALLDIGFIVPVRDKADHSLDNIEGKMTAVSAVESSHKVFWALQSKQCIRGFPLSINSGLDDVALTAKEILNSIHVIPGSHGFYMVNPFVDVLFDTLAELVTLFQIFCKVSHHAILLSHIIDNLIEISVKLSLRDLVPHKVKHLNAKLELLDGGFFLMNQVLYDLGSCPVRLEFISIEYIPEHIGELFVAVLLFEVERLAGFGKLDKFLGVSYTSCCCVSDVAFPGILFGF